MTRKRKTYIDKLEELDACREAVEWCRSYSSLQKAWDACERSDWMLWLLAEKLPFRKKHLLVLCACDFAARVLKYVASSVPQAKRAVELARSWAEGNDVSPETLKSAVDDARAAARAVHAADAAAAYAADAAYYADAASYTASYAAADAAGAAAADAAYYADADRAAVYAERKAQTGIIRKHFPKAPRI